MIKDQHFAGPFLFGYSCYSILLQIISHSMSHGCRSLIIHCMDFRFIRQLTEYFQAAGHMGDADFVGWAGSGKAFLDPLGKDFVLQQVTLSTKLHDTREVHIVNHLDCGAYGGAKAFPDRHAKHVADLSAVKALLAERFPQLAFTGYIASLQDGTVSVEKLDV